MSGKRFNSKYSSSLRSQTFDEPFNDHFTSSPNRFRQADVTRTLSSVFPAASPSACEMNSAAIPFDSAHAIPRSGPSTTSGVSHPSASKARVRRHGHRCQRMLNRLAGRRIDNVRIPLPLIFPKMLIPARRRHRRIHKRHRRFQSLLGQDRPLDSNPPRRSILTLPTRPTFAAQVPPRTPSRHSPS